MLAYLIIIFAVLATLHFLYETCVLPQLRLEQKYELFRLRDQLRELRAADEIHDLAAFAILQDSLNNALHNVDRSDLRLLTEVQSHLNDPEIAAVIKERLAILKACNDEKLVEVRGEMRRVTSLAVAFGMGGLIPYILPIAIICYLLHTCRERFRYLIRALLVLPAGQASASYEYETRGMHLA